MDWRGSRALLKNTMLEKTILFTRDTNPDLEGADFKAGETKTLNVASATRWLRRNAAVEVPAPTIEPEVPAKTPAAKAPAAGDKK